MADSWCCPGCWSPCCCSCCCPCDCPCIKKEDEQSFVQSLTTDERSPVITQAPSRNYTDGSQNEHKLRSLRDEKEHLCQQVRNLNSRLKEEEDRYQSDIGIRDLEIKKLKLDVEKLESNNKDLLTRLSAVASARLTDENPNIADLSDVNRPTKLSEQFSELYDNEWTDAFDALEKSNEGQNIEEECCKRLLDILTRIFSTCLTKAKDDLQKITKALSSFNGVDMQSKEVLKTLKDDRKKNHSFVIEILSKEVQMSLKDLITEQEASLISAFIKKCISICWLMGIQDPPVCIDVLTDLHGARFNTDLYKAYTQSGAVIDYIVWPVLYLHEGGNLLSKGIAQGTKAESDDSKNENARL